MKDVHNVLIALSAFFIVLAGCSLGGNGSGSRDSGGQNEIRTEKVIEGLSNPVDIATASDGSDRLFIVEQGGAVRILNQGVLLATPFLDVSDRISCCGERGLLGLAFPPGYATKRYFYINYTNTSGDTVISRLHVPARSPNRADPESEYILLTITQPYSNHNGGHISFGPDGYLYIGMGDGGAGGDPMNNAQNPGTLLGKLLRIDVESGLPPYSVPKDNPFVSDPAYRPEIWATGLRNPWRFSFDRDTGDLFIADVGQDDYEEIDFQSVQNIGGENYGWNIMEGSHCFNAPTCDQAGLVLPVAEYDHTAGCSVTGGAVYRGSLYPPLIGMYLYGDFCSGRIWGLQNVAGEWMTRQLADTSFMIAAFGEDEDGTIYIADYKAGTIYRIVAAP